MQQGAPRLAILLANDLREGARQAADRDRARVAAAGAVELRPTGPNAPHWFSRDGVRRHLARVPAAHAAAR